MAADSPPAKGAKGGECTESEGGGEGELPKLGSVNVPPPAEYGMAIGTIDCDRCLVKDNLAALVGKRAQTDEGMGERGHDMACHC
jgi:hypothetical protein